MPKFTVPVGKEPKGECKILFIIGNGFDLGLGMKTRYSDMYESYINSKSKSESIKAFKVRLSNDIKYENWSDFEMAMAKKANDFSSENEFVECIRDFKKHMADHLERETQNKVEKLGQVAFTEQRDVMWESITNFEYGLIPNDVKEIKRIRGDKDLTHSFLTFNYTKIFDYLLRFVNIYDYPLHIHGTLGEDIVTGVDGDDQLVPTKYKITRKTERAFIKPKFNESFDVERIKQAANMITESNIICSYGFSYGQSDRMWLNLISQWLLANAGHHLVAFMYDDTLYDKINPDIRMDAEEEKKIELLKKLGLSDNDEIFKQVHIPVGYDIFDINFDKTEASLQPV
ncbi:MAG: hypothetical protein IKA62_03990 [Clostridia bacterium]|nr:hypothetical protein [Clostridia bacterium]